MYVIFWIFPFKLFKCSRIAENASNTLTDLCQSIQPPTGKKTHRILEKLTLRIELCKNISIICLYSRVVILFSGKPSSH